MATASSRNDSPPRIVTAITMTPRTSAEITRNFRLLIDATAVRTARSQRNSALEDAAKSPFAYRVLAKRLGQMVGGELGPVARHEHQFAVGCLPGQEIRHPQFAAGAYHQVGIGNSGCIEIFGEHLGGHGFVCK